MQTRIQETSAIWYQHFLGKKWHFRSWHCLLHLSSTVDQHLGLVLHTFTSLSALYIQKQLHRLAGYAKKKDIHPSQPPPATPWYIIRKRRTLRFTKGTWGHPGDPCQGPSRSKFHKTSEPRVLQVTFTVLIPPRFSKTRQIGIPFVPQVASKRCHGAHVSCSRTSRF